MTDPTAIADEIVYGLDWNHEPNDEWPRVDSQKLHAAIAQAIRDAYERAADTCEEALYNTKNSCSDDAIYDATQAIRALKDNPA